MPLQVEDSPAQAEIMNEAISVIAEARGSERLKRFITSGIDRAPNFSPISWCLSDDSVL